MSKYEINFEREILREKSAGILADFDRYLEDNNIDYDDIKNPIILLERAIVEIYRNIFKPEYDNMISLKEVNAKLDLATEILNKLS
ncbi:hypothetical protein [Fusobacterium sp.]|uniref:hypothetical protein n=1 Tax=Fusobacterium sp. TaxID=68766 RepID=UPI0025BC99EF|nr:hypothetical protein [Fusobacterium sp.]